MLRNIKTSVLYLLLIGILGVVGCNSTEGQPNPKPFSPGGELKVIAPLNSGYWFVEKEVENDQGDKEKVLGDTHYIDSYRWVAIPHTSEYPERRGRIVEFEASDKSVLYLSMSRDGRVVYERVDWFFGKDNSDAMYFCRSEQSRTLEQVKALPEPNRSDLTSGCNGAAWIKGYRDLDISGEWTEIDSRGVKTVEDAFSISYNYFIDDKIVARSNERKWLVIEKGGKFSRFVWQVNGPVLKGCFDQEGVATSADAASAPVKNVDFTNDETGCKGNALTVLHKILPFMSSDSWKLDDSIEKEISPSEFVGQPIEYVDNRMGYFVTSSKDFSGNKIYKLYNYRLKGWRDAYFCPVDLDLSSIEEAIHYDLSKVDRGNMMSGCLGKPWAHLSRDKDKAFNLSGFWYTSSRSPQRTYEIGDEWMGQRIVKYDPDKKWVITSYRDQGRLLFNRYVYKLIKTDLTNRDLNVLVSEELVLCEKGKQARLSSVLDRSDLGNVHSDDLASGCYKKKWDQYSRSTKFAGIYLSENTVIKFTPEFFEYDSNAYQFISKIGEKTYFFTRTGKFHLFHFEEGPAHSSNVLYCLVKKDQTATTFDAAKTNVETATYDPSNASTGCGGKAWKRLKGVSVVGNWLKETGTEEILNITREVWGNRLMEYYYIPDDEKYSVVVVKDESANSRGYRRIYYTPVEVKNDMRTFKYCEFNKSYPKLLNAKPKHDNFLSEHELKSLGLPNVDLPETGCNGGPWTELRELTW